MRIFLGSDTYYPDVNGASYFTQRLAAGLRDRGHDMHVAAVSRTRRSRIVARDRVTEHHVRSLSLPGRPGFRVAPPGVYRHLLAEVERTRPDVIHTQGHFVIGRTMIAVGKQLGVPVVATNHFMPDNLTPYLHLPAALERAVAGCAWSDFARVFGSADVVTAPTSFAARLAEAKGVPGPVQAISCGIDRTRFSPSTDPRPFRIRHRLDDRLSITFVGRLDPEKHVDELIRALPGVRRCVDAQLVVVGTGRELERLQRLALTEGVGDAVTFTGFVPDPDLPGAYAAADVCVNPGTAELQSIVTLEAMASGKPVIGARARALPLLVRDGVNGHLFEPGDVSGLARALVRILADTSGRERMGRASLRLISNHDIDATIDEFEDVYRELTAGRPGRHRSESWRSVVVAA